MPVNPAPNPEDAPVPNKFAPVVGADNPGTSDDCPSPPPPKPAAKLGVVVDFGNPRPVGFIDRPLEPGNIIDEREGERKEDPPRPEDALRPEPVAIIDARKGFETPAWPVNPGRNRGPTPVVWPARNPLPCPSLPNPPKPVG